MLTSKCQSESEVNVADTFDKTSTTAGIQEAIDALPSSGGIVRIPPGRYILQRSIVLKSNVKLVGAGASTVITRPALKYYDLAKTMSGVSKNLNLKNTKGIKIGDELLVGSIVGHGWHSRHVVVSEVNKKSLKVKYVAQDVGRSYKMSDAPIVANWFPAISAWDSKNISIEDITIDGGVKKHARLKTDFTVSAIHTSSCLNVHVHKVHILDWPGDGVSLQGGKNALVDSCIIENSCGPGLHPGTGIVYSTWTNNISRRNTRDGYFFCMNVVQAICQGNQLIENGENGIGGLTDPDRQNIIQGNVCSNNRRHGIEAERSIGNIIQGNHIRNNSQEKAGVYAGIYLSEHKNNIVKDNICLDDQQKPTQLKGVLEEKPGSPNWIGENPLVINNIATQ